ncbi:hypothetical protein MNBD_GAMMA16-1729, partial [hydrothermal vent metagenome]
MIYDGGDKAMSGLFISREDGDTHQNN